MTQTIQHGQWRLSAVELVNWGTFQGHHGVDVAREGFLLTGHSGSGKSSLIDAISAVLTPPKSVRFNAAALDAGSRGDDRSLVSYIRGAWRRQTQADTGEVASEFLRSGATWSGIQLRYSDGTHTLSLIRVMHLKRGTNSSADVTSLYLVGSGSLDILDLEPYVRSGIDVRRIKAEFSDAMVSNKHSAFAAKFRRQLGIHGENALQLLHKTQSAKNLGSLDSLFRSFMLDEPSTFDLAATATEQFANLAEAHHRVVEARQQVEHLSGLPALAKNYDEGLIAVERARTLQSAIDPFTAVRKRELVRKRLAALDAELREFAEQLNRARSHERDAQAEYDRAREQVNNAGGSALDAAIERSNIASETADRLREARAALATRLGDVGIPLPESSDGFSELKATARSELTALDDSRERAKTIVAEAHDARASAATALAALDAEIASLRTRRSNIDSSLVSARTLLARIAQVPESTLPFAGELIEVAEPHADWRGAIERVLRPFATVMLVPSEHIDAVTRAADAQHLGTRLVFERIPRTLESPSIVRSERSVVNRVRVKPGPSQAYVVKRLSDSYDFECVDSAADFKAASRAVTRAGQVKRAPGRFEKDDRFHVSDASRWILGWDNAAKVEHLITRRAEADAALRKAEAHVAEISAKQRAAESRALVLKDLAYRTWSEIDVEGAVAAISEREREIDTLRAASADLRAAEDAARAADERRRTARAHTSDAEVSLRQSEKERDELARLAETVSSSDTALEEDIAYELTTRFSRERRSWDLSTIDTVARHVADQLRADERAASSLVSNAETGIVKNITNFAVTWRAAAANLATGIDARSGYLALLETLVSSNLPAYEERFFDLLRDQAQQLTGQLLNQIRRSPSDIRARIEPVNTSLRRSQFDAGRYLQIAVKNRHTDTVKQFMSDLQTVSSGSWNDEDRASAEKRFAVLQRIMARLSSSTSADITWRNECLDTRLHVSFTGVEEDENGEVLNVHDSSAGLSGGQRQKLVIFCLAAALRYQLTEDEDQVPSFGTIVLDEAFDKADNEFTRMAMDVFHEFGFHMFLATPLKLLQTIEQYVGGIGLVTCRDRQQSRVQLVDFSTAAGSVEEDAA